MRFADKRWYAGEGEPELVQVLVEDELAPGVRWQLVAADGVVYQVFPGGEDDDDVLEDHDVACAVLAALDPTLETGHVRPLGAEQSNTSLVYGEDIVVKVYRRPNPTPNLDVEVTTGLAAGGFPHVAEPIGVWRRDGFDLAFAQRYLAGASDGWSLALTSIRDLYASEGQDPALRGGDFAPEAGRLGTVTAELHIAMAQVFGVVEADPSSWAADLDVGDEPAARRAAERLARVADAGRAIRTHGDYHLGQVLRTDAGWHVLDFEGEPSRPPEERRRPRSPLRDVAGMLRSFQYATRVALFEQSEEDRDALLTAGEAWELRNRERFLEAYLRTPGIEALIPAAGDDVEAVLTAYEVEKAVYELAYERAFRPQWTDIPRAALARLLA